VVVRIGGALLAPVAACFRRMVMHDNTLVYGRFKYTRRNSGDYFGGAAGDLWGGFGGVSHLRRSGRFLWAVFPALTDRANLCRAFGAGARMICGHCGFAMRSGRFGEARVASTEAVALYLKR
jgi:hypothetical protein